MTSSSGRCGNHRHFFFFLSLYIKQRNWILRNRDTEPEASNLCSSYPTMKFGKEFQSQMVQEWQVAYMDYNSLKNILKDVIRSRPPPPPPPQQQQKYAVSSDTSDPSRIKRRVSFYRAFSGLTTRYGSPRKRDEDEVILVSSNEESHGGRYHTMFMKPSEEGGEFELMFFRKLDDEFNKVVKFYKDKVTAAVAEADELSRQMNALIVLRIKVDKPAALFDLVGADADVAGSPPTNKRPTGKTNH